MLPEKLKEIIEDFKILDSQDERYEALIELGQELPEFPENLKTERNLIAGCMSEVYIDVTVEGNNVKIQGWAQSVLVKGLIAVFVLGLNNLTVEELLSISPDFITETGITSSLTSSRANTPLTVLETIKNRIRRQTNN